jgi:hypothetical protein
MSRSFNVAAVRTTELHCSNDTIWEGSTRSSNDVATLPNVTQCSKIFRVSFTDAERSDSINRPDAWSSHPDAVIFLEELHYSRMAVAEDRPDAAK